MGRLLEPLARGHSAVTGRQPPKHARWSPEPACDVEFVEWTHTRTMRAPCYKGLRDDVAPKQVGFAPAPDSPRRTTSNVGVEATASQGACSHSETRLVGRLRRDSGDTVAKSARAALRDRATSRST